MSFATFSGLYTLFLLCIFIALIVWVYSKRQKNKFEKTGKSIFNESELMKINENDTEKSGVKK